MSILSRRRFLGRTAAFGALAALPRTASAAPTPVLPVALSTWGNRRANAAAWDVLAAGGPALDAAEAGARIPEADPSDTSVGLGGRPDRTGRVTLDACVMDHLHRCGAVAGLEDVVHAVSVARRVMEATPHVMLVGEGARDFAIAQGFETRRLLTAASETAWLAWLETPEGRPAVNVERRDGFAPEDDHDTIGMLTLAADATLAGACTTSGWAYKLRGRVGDSPIIGAGLYVDGEVGAATATGHGEEMVRTAAAHTVVEAMRHGRTPTEACRLAVERLRRVTPSDVTDVQAGMLALTPDGRVGGFALQPGFNYVVTLPDGAPEPEGRISGREPVPGGTTFTVEADALMG